MPNIIYGLLVLFGIGLLLGLLLAFADAKLTIKEDERVEALTKLLPGYNCGVCGYPGCKEMAVAILSGKVKQISQCKPSRADERQAIIEYLQNAPNANGNIVELK